jgi:glycosyltransferase involved in cell wall biosynthesis
MSAAHRVLPHPAAASAGERVCVTVVIKTLNEEVHLRGAIESALAALAPVGGEVIVADSGSTDRTVEIARRYPVTVVQLADPAERRCGIGPQLGFQFARGQFVYILDGDMELDPGFVEQAVAAMNADPTLAGVAGSVEEESEASYQFRGRKRRARESSPRNDCEWLDMGGLYRAEALRAVGYFSNRNLHAYEEMDLGLRLCAAGWRLRRLPLRGVLHHGRSEDTWALLQRRWRTRYLDGAGEVLRAALGRPWFYRVVQTQAHVAVGLALWLALLASLVALAWTPYVLAAVLAVAAGLVAVRAVRIGSLRDALLGQVVWQVTALATIRGFLARPRDPCQPIDAVLLAEPGVEGEGARSLHAGCV